MNLILEPWHWFILGVFLLLLELLLPSFAALWFGLSALLVGVTLSFMPDLAFTHQLFMWTGFSLGCTYGWFKWIKPLAKNRTNAGQARENTIGQIGIVIQTQLANDHVRVRFTLPILG
ncbi:MAG: NfeD family protein, partial [Acinetobacter sp.]|nr:NfeD family protein [Acinetobacter sp.]